MKKVKMFFRHNIQQFKWVFLIGSCLFSFFIAALVFFGDQKYSLFDKITLPIVFGLLTGVILVLILFVSGFTNWLYTEYYFKKKLSVLIDNYRFDMSPFKISVWKMTNLALYGKLENYNIIIQNGVEQGSRKNLFILFNQNDITPNNIDTCLALAYSYKNLKKTGIEPLITELTHLIQRLQSSK